MRLIRFALVQIFALAFALSAATASSLAPGPPIGVAASSGLTGEIQLSWGAPVTGVGAAVSRYVVQRSTGPADTFVDLFTSADAAQTTYRDQNLPANAAFDYRIVALDGAGNQGTPSAAARGTTAVAAINDLRLASGVTSAGVPLTWSFVSGASGYQIYRGAPGGPYTLLSSVTSLVHLYTAPPLVSGKPTAYVVKSRSGTTWSGYSNEVVATLPAGTSSTSAGAAAPTASSPAPAAPTPAPVAAKSKDTLAPAAKPETDKGGKDPTDFPRPPGLVRTSYSQAPGKLRDEEIATYHSQAGIDENAGAFLERLQAAGWKKGADSVSGAAASSTRIIEWTTPAKEAEVRFYALKGSGSDLRVRIFTYKTATQAASPDTATPR